LANGYSNKTPVNVCVKSLLTFFAVKAAFHDTDIIAMTSVLWNAAFNHVTRVELGGYQTCVTAAI